MRKIDSTCLVNYKIINKDLKVDYLKKSTNCFSEIFQLKEMDFDKDTIIILCNFRAEENLQYIKKYFEILSKIFKIDIVYLDEDTIEVKNFKSLFYLKSFLTLYRLLFEPANSYDANINDFDKHILFFEELCNADFKELDELQQLCTSYNNTNIYKAGHCIKIGSNHKVKIISIKELDEFEPDLKQYQFVNKFFTEIPEVL